MRFVVLICLFFITVIGTVYAKPPPQEWLNYGQTTTGNITDEQFRQLHLFQGRAGQIVSLHMSRASDNLDPYLVLVTAEGKVLATGDDHDTSRDAAIPSVVLPADGVYTVIATRFGHEHGTTTGEYELFLESLGTTAETGTTVRYGDAIPGEINDEKPEDIYVLQGQRGDVITIRMARTSGDLDPLLNLFDASGQVLITGDDDETSREPLNAGILNYMLPADGSYYIRATRYGYANGPSRGTYLLQISLVPPNELGTRPTNARFIEYGDVVEGMLDDDVPVRFFRFEAERGDIVSAVVTQQSGDLAPTISLLASDLRLVSDSPEDEDQTETRIPGASIPETGSYFLTVSRFGGFEGETGGTFVLQLEGRAGIANSESLEIIYGGQVYGNLDDNNHADVYIFVGTADDIITITMRNVEGDLDPLVILRNANSKQLIADDDSFTEGGRDAAIRDFRLPEDGIYQIEATRYERIAGTSTGTYSLTLDLARQN